MKKALFFLGLLFSLYNANAALPVFDWMVFGQMLQEVACLENQITELKNHGTYLQQELEQLKGGDYKWSDAQVKINEVGGLVNQTTQLAYNASDLDTNFKRTFPGYKPPTNYSDNYKNIVTNTLNTLNAILRGVGTNAANFQTESTRLKFLQDRAQNAQGQTQAIQAASQISSEEVTQLQLLRQTVVAQTNAQTAYYAAQVQKEASVNSSFDQLVSSSKQDVNGKLDQSPLDSKF